MTSFAPDQTCGCADFQTGRRTFLKGTVATAGALATTAVFGDVFTQVAYGAEAGGNVLVVLSLRGGADGLSMVVPHGDRDYAPARPRIAVPAGQLLAADPLFGLHPAFAPLLPLWNTARFAAVQAVGLPQPNRSHFAAMEAVEDADPGSAERRGWINRMVGLVGTANPAEAIQLGTPMAPTSLYGSAPTLAADRLRDLQLSGSSDPVWRGRQEDSLTRVWGSVGGALGRGARSALDTTTTFSALASAPVSPQNGAAYPSGGLGTALAETAALVRAELGTRVVTLDYGSWDMHTSMGTVSSGQMRNRVDEMARALGAFFTDLGALGDRVTVVTLSEFGRRVAENGANGLDHGHGNCVLVLGGGVRGGKYYGTWPGLADGSLVSGDLAVTTDYRSVLAEIVGARFPAVSLPTLFPGFAPQPLGLMAAA
ncbi:MAG: DUF1501 domain-containing protein [Actinomycetota bacterium]|nr:DUF1501 domain-containing protein [Actinomycetota bacterium]